MTVGSVAVRALLADGESVGVSGGVFPARIGVYDKAAVKRIEVAEIEKQLFNI
jgi:hypothetical protein